VTEWTKKRVKKMGNDFGQGKVGGAVAACAKDQGELTVTVTNRKDGKTIRGATVKITGPDSGNKSSDQNGTATFKCLRPGNYNIEASMKDFSTEKATANVPAGGKQSATLVLSPPVNPLITPAKQVVVVKKPHTTPSRRPLQLKTDAPFTGTGMLTRAPSNTVRFFTSGGTEITFNGTDNVFAGAQLSGGVPIFAEGAAASSKLNDVEITLKLSGGVNPSKTAAKAHLTSVEASLEICQSRTKAGTEPAPLPQPPAAAPGPGVVATDKWYGGRFLQVQDGSHNAGRAVLIISKVKPAAFSGELIVKRVNDKVDMFAAEAPGGAAIGAEFKIAAGDVPGGGKQLWVEGKNKSGGLRDTGFTLAIKDVEPNCDRVSATVAQFTEIKATIQSTPANTPRAGIAAPADHVYKNTSISEDFAINKPLVLMRNAQPNIALEVTAAPAGLPIRWQAIRNKADAAKLGSSTEVPTVTSTAATPHKATLNTERGGSFRVRAYIDCNGSTTYSEKEPSIPLNLVLADVTLVADNSAANPGTHAPNTVKATIDATGVLIENGKWPTGATLTATDLNDAGMGMEIIADVTGGGADGTLGLDCVFAGLVNNLANDEIGATYTDSSVAPAKNYGFKNIYVSNGGDGSGSFEGNPVFKSGDHDPKIFAFPHLDTGRDGAGAGGETACMGRSGPPTPGNRPIGKRWTIRCVDSPSRWFSSNHPVTAAAVLTKIHYRQEFIANFCFWTNITKSRAATGDPADRRYSVLRIIPWQIVADWNVDYSVNPPTLTATTAHKITSPAAGRTEVKPIGRAQDHHVEVRPPSGIRELAGVKVLVWDAR
jgi:hypothetical protein